MRWLPACVVAVVLAMGTVVTASAVPHKRAPMCGAIAGRTINETPSLRVFRAHHGGLRVCARGLRGAESPFSATDCAPLVDNCVFSQLTLGPGRYYAYAERINGGKNYGTNEALFVYRTAARPDRLPVASPPAGGPAHPSTRCTSSTRGAPRWSIGLPGLIQRPSP